jgi:hypothetical protein
MFNFKMGTGIISYEKCTNGAVPSLRRNYPVQVQRVLSQLFKAPRGRGKINMDILIDQL